MIGRLLAIDHGLARIGVAVSDALGISARELCIINRKSRQEDFAQINEIAQTEDVAAIVVGIPHHEAPHKSYAQADTVRLWIQRLRQTTDRPIIEWDEQLSTKDAEVLARHIGRKPTDPVDDLAARIILQSYLDALADGLATPLPRL